MSRVGEELDLQCPACSRDIRLITLMTKHAPIRNILMHLGEPL
jgi:hypothetical protein